ncbi:MAG: chemotaxis response regulator protein-glutamate methylesterase [Gemmataceae bacterium]
MLAEQPTRILVVDDSALYRQTLKNTLRGLAETEVVGIAKNGKDALEKIEQLDPDVLTLDVEMPDMNGIDVLREMKRRNLRCRAIMVSSFTSEGAQITTDALLEGAFDFILKPSGGDPEANRQRLLAELTEKIEAFRHTERRTKRKRTRPTTLPGSDGAELDLESTPNPQASCQAVLIGVSTGGPAALKMVLPRIPADFPVPILVVQHMAAHFTTSLAKRLDELCDVRVMEASDDMDIQAGTVVIAPGGKQTKILSQGQRVFAQTTDDPPENNCRPAVDYMFRSASAVWEGNVLGVILTGMGRDGTQGCQNLKAKGGYVFAQAEDGCVVYGMPKAVIEEGLADRVLPFGKIAPAIVRHVKRSRRV